MMKTRRKARKISQKHCLCDCNTTTQKTPNKPTTTIRKVKSPITKSAPKKRTKQINKSIKQHLLKTQNTDVISPVVILKKSLSPLKKPIKNNGKILKKEPFVVLKQLGIKSPTMQLRTNRYRNYCEPPSFNESINEKPVEKAVEKTVERIPIYKQHIEDNEPKKKKKKKKNKIDDLYEFDSDSEKNKPTKHKQRKLKDSSHDEYNKTIENILRNVAAKIKDRKHSPGEQINGNTTVTATINNKTNNKKVGRPPKQPDKRQQTNEAKAVQIVKNINEKIETTLPKPLPVPSDTQLVKNNDNNDHKIENTTEKPSVYDDPDDTFGFIEDNQELSEIPIIEPNKTPRIHIISDYTLKPNEELTFMKNPTSPIRRPNANSTMINNVLTPWRFNDINIKRNPHFIQTKPTSLPSITQEPVLEYSMIEKFNSSTPRRESDDGKNSIMQTPILRKSPRKFPTPSIQKTLDDYYGGGDENKENSRQIANQSLFDIHELSPIKVGGINQSPIKNRSPIKRQILGDLNDNNENLNKPNELLTYFGFDTSHDSENISNIDNDKMKDHPYRLSINVNDKKYEVKKKTQKTVDIEDKVHDEEVEELSHEKMSDDEDEEDEMDKDVRSNGDNLEGAGLFEDFHDVKEKNQIKVKKKRKVRWMQTDNDKPKRRRKDVRTKQEEEEAEQWAQQFNSMCKEVEEFPLEIE